MESSKHALQLFILNCLEVSVLRTSKGHIWELRPGPPKRGGKGVTTEFRTGNLIFFPPKLGLEEGAGEGC